MQQGSMNTNIGLQIFTDNNCVHFVNEDNEHSFIEENGANKGVLLRDGRSNFLFLFRIPWLLHYFYYLIFRITADEDGCPLQIQVWPVQGERTLYYVRLRTSHYSFCLKNSCVIRDISEFYQLRSILTVSGRFPCPLIFEDTFLVHVKM